MLAHLGLDSDRVPGQTSSLQRFFGCCFFFFGGRARPNLIEGQTSEREEVEASDACLGNLGGGNWIVTCRVPPGLAIMVSVGAGRLVEPIRCCPWGVW